MERQGGPNNRTVYCFESGEADPKELIDENLLDAVIGLPANLFYGTGIPAAILSSSASEPITQCYSSTPAASLAGHESETACVANHERIVQTYRARQNVQRYAYRATRAGSLRTTTT